MSSAALQSASHQSSTTTTATTVAALNSPPLVAVSPAGRHHQQQQQSISSPSRHPYHATSQNSVSSPSSGSKRPSRKQSGASGGGKGDVPSQSNSPMSSRAALASPIPVNTTYSDQNCPPSSSDRRKNMPSAVVPPRSSSQHAQGNNGGGSSSRKQPSQGGERSNPQRYGGTDANGQASASHIYQDDAMAQSSRSRRSGHPGGGQEQTYKSSTSQRDSSRATGPSTSVPIRTQQATPGSSQAPSREVNETVNNMLVSQPDVDMDRERAQAHQTAPVDETVPPPGIPTTADLQHGEEPRRGGRSRHDYSKREKHTKFGEYILGNTIGEGEFGKVKLGWKQEGGVQVRTEDPVHAILDSDTDYSITFRSPSSLSRRTSSAATRPAWPRSCVKLPS